MRWLGRPLLVFACVPEAFCSLILPREAVSIGLGWVYGEELRFKGNDFLDDCIVLFLTSVELPALLSLGSLDHWSTWYLKSCSRCTMCWDLSSLARV